MDKATMQEIDLYLSEIKNGNISVMSDLYDLTSKTLYVLCLSYFKNKDDAQSALSDSFYTIILHINKFTGHSGFNWMYTITKNTCLNLVKKAKREIPMDLQDEETIAYLDAQRQDTFEAADESGILQLAKKILNPHEQQIVYMHAVEGYRFGEISKITGRLEATVRWQYNNALKKLRKAYKE